MRRPRRLHDAAAWLILPKAAPKTLCRSHGVPGDRWEVLEAVLLTMVSTATHVQPAPALCKTTAGMPKRYRRATLIPDERAGLAFGGFVCCSGDCTLPGILYTCTNHDNISLHMATARPGIARLGSRSRRRFNRYVAASRFGSAAAEDRSVSATKCAPREAAEIVFTRQVSNRTYRSIDAQAATGLRAFD